MAKVIIVGLCLILAGCAGNTYDPSYLAVRKCVVENRC